MFQVIRGPDGSPAIVTRAEIGRAKLLLNPVARAICGRGRDTGARLPGVLPFVEMYVRRMGARS
jgi:hypothetical protein